MKKFWNWESGKTDGDSRVLTIDGIIAEESWYDDDVTPKVFKSELQDGEGDITLWLNSPGGDCVAASQIYTMLTDYKGSVTVKIDGQAASAASVIAMAGDKVLMSPTSIMMVHNPLTMAFGDVSEMQKAIDALSEYKESIINAYHIKTGMSRAKLSHYMDAETWMNAKKAIELGFADDMLTSETHKEQPDGGVSFAFSRRAVQNRLLNKVAAKSTLLQTEKLSIAPLDKRLNNIIH